MMEKECKLQNLSGNFGAGIGILFILVVIFFAIVI